jgi:hypothetical protein
MMAAAVAAAVAVETVPVRVNLPVVLQACTLEPQHANCTVASCEGRNQIKSVSEFPSAISASTPAHGHSSMWLLPGCRR